MKGSSCLGELLLAGYTPFPNDHVTAIGRRQYSGRKYNKGRRDIPAFSCLCSVQAAGRVIRWVTTASSEQSVFICYATGATTPLVPLCALAFRIEMSSRKTLKILPLKILRRVAVDAHVGISFFDRLG